MHCLALNNKYTSEKNLSKLINEYGGTLKDGYIVVSYDENLTDKRFISITKKDQNKCTY